MRYLWPFVLVAFILTADALAPDSIHPLGKAGAFDEACHLATGVLVVAALRPYLPRDSAVALVAASVLIDLDHVPDALGSDWLTRGAPRPYTHSVLTLAVIGLAAVVWRARRAATIGACIAIAMHFTRDMSEPQGSGVALLWPFSNHPFALPYSGYVALLGALAAAGVIHMWRQRPIAVSPLPPGRSP